MEQVRLNDLINRTDMAAHISLEQWAAKAGAYEER